MLAVKWKGVLYACVAIALAAMMPVPGQGLPALAQSGEEAPQNARGPNTPAVELARAERVEDPRERVFVGRVTPLNKVDLAFQVSGQILELPISEGERREEGALIASLDPVDFELAVREARAAYDLAEIKFERVAKLEERGTVAQAPLDEARADKTYAKIALRTAERRLRQATIDAPFDALVARVLADRFSNTTPQQPVVRLQDVSEMRIIVSLPEEIAALARTETESFVFTATFPAAPGYEATLALREFVTEANPVAQTYQVEFAITGEVDPRLLPGMTAKVSGVSAPGSRPPPVVVPVGAIDTTDDTGARVWVFDSESATVAPRDVQVGLPRDGSIIVFDALSPGERVVSAGWQGLTEGAEVRVSQR